MRPRYRARPAMLALTRVAPRGPETVATGAGSPSALQQDRVPFGRRPADRRGAQLPQQLLRRGELAVDVGVGLVGVVVEEAKLLHPGAVRQRRRRADAGMAPADLARIFLVGVGRVGNQ